MQLKVWRLEKLASKCQTPEWSTSGLEHDNSTLESENDTCSGLVSEPVGMSTLQLSYSTAEKPWPSPLPTPVLPTMTDVTPVCRLPSTAL